MKRSKQALTILGVMALGVLMAAAPSAFAATNAVWSPGPNFPTNDVRSVGVFFPANGKFYAMGGRTSDSAGSDLLNPAEFDPVGNTWTIKSGTFDDNQVNNMAAGVLNVGGTDYIFTVGGSAAGAATATAEVRRYDPVADSFSFNAYDAWPGDAGGAVLPGGFAVFNNMLFLIGGFQINVGMENFIYQFDPNAAPGSQWTLKTATLTNQPLGYIPACTIGSLIYTAGGSMWTGSTLADTTDSYVYDPVADTISLLTNQIPRATAETRALNVGGQMWVLGGGRVAPNPSNEVDIYDPVAGTWSTGLAFATPRRNFPAETDGSAVWLVGGYAPTSPTNTMEIYSPSTCGTILISPASLPNGTFGVNYNQLLTATGGVGPFTFAVTTGALPNGITLSPAGLLSGPPTQVGTFNFTVTATDTFACTGTHAYALTIDCGTISISPSTLPNGQTGVPYSQTFTGSGGAAPYTFAIVGGSLPAGLTLDSAGNLTGTPTAGGTSFFTVRATDSFGCFVQTAYGLTIDIVFSVTSISPECGPAAGATPVTIDGFSFDSAATVTIAGLPAVNVVVVSSTQITADTPPNSAGTVGDVVVTNPGPVTATLTNGYAYDFLDVLSGNPFEPFVCKLVRGLITGGCDATHYCPNGPIVRSQMSVFILRAVHGPTYVPPVANCATYPFPDVTCPSAFANFILEAFNEGIMGVGEDTACGAGLFCPSHAVTRLSMAYILLRGEHGGSYVPPSANCGTFPFLDVPCPSQDADFVGELVAEGITGGCDATHYCPTASLNRAQMAVFITVTFNLQ
jgi:hypothetical protein